jgi:hypothetical protein
MPKNQLKSKQVSFLDDSRRRSSKKPNPADGNPYEDGPGSKPRLQKNRTQQYQNNPTQGGSKSSPLDSKKELQ